MVGGGGEGNINLEQKTNYEKSKQIPNCISVCGNILET